MSDPFDLSGQLPPPLAPFPGAASGTPSPPAVIDSSYLDGLNDTQRHAVNATEGPVLVLAGAGTGKTRVLITRLAHILLCGKAGPWNVLAVTFTNRAAIEMKERVSAVLGRPIEGWWVGTFHALGARILRSHAEAIGLKSNFTILDADDQLRLIKQLLEPYAIDEKKWPPRVLLGIIQRWKDRGLTPQKVTAPEGADEADGDVLKLYADYQRRLLELNAADFGDLLLHCLDLFQTAPEILKEYQEQFRYILVDEYQDTNVAQYLWLRLLAQSHKNICCVGDDDQSIYSWRGAEVANILGFEKDFPDATIIRLECNYRSTPNILAAASGLIAHNDGRLGKTLWTDLTEEGEKVSVRGVWDGVEEARVVGDEIEAYQSKNHAMNEIAILVRTGFQTREFEERLITLGIPYRVIGGPRFYERMEIRDAVAYLRVIDQPADDLAFERIVNTPKRGLGDVTLQTLHQLARATGVPLTTAAAQVMETDEIRPAAARVLSDLLVEFQQWRDLAKTMQPAELVKTVLDQSGYIDMWRMHRSIEGPGRVDNLNELIAALEEFETLQDFLEHVSLVMENEQAGEREKVTIMTMHGAKGLEFDTVFMPGWEEGLFPHQRSLDENGLEEERRLAYVGLTRARKRVIILFAANRRIYNNWQSAIPSRFIDELPSENVARLSSRGLYGAGKAERKGGGIHARTRGHSAAFASSQDAVDDPFWEDDHKESSMRVGLRVFHQKFGYGQILNIDGAKLKIAFEKAGEKMVMDSFVKVV